MPRVLLVEDNELNRDMLSRRLTKNGWEVTSAEDGLQGVEMASRDHPHIILMDLSLPLLSGWNAARWIKANPELCSIPIIALSAHAMRDRLHLMPDVTSFNQGVHFTDEPAEFDWLCFNDGLWDWDLVSGEIYYSPRWKEMIGFNEAELTADPSEWLSRVHDADRQKLQTTLEAHIRSGYPTLEFEYRLRHRNGSYRWMSIRALAVRDLQGKASRIVGSQSDVTDKITIDSLTGLANRLLFESQLSDSLQRLRDDPQSRFAVLYIDVDRFKLINDSLGHSFGDQLLREIALRLRQSVRDMEISSRPDNDVVARLGGDEFAIVLNGIGTREQAAKACERLIRTMRPVFRLQKLDIYSSLSIGTVLASEPSDDSSALLRDADTAMYAAKAAGGGCWAIFEPAMQDRVRLRLQTETDLRHALDREELRVYYQPRVTLSTGEIRGFEALLRWVHPERGLIMPGEFISITEETGLIVRIGMWVLKEACRQMQSWHLRYPHLPPLDVAVNLSARQCREPGLVDEVKAVLRETGLSPECLHLELTESLLLEDVEAAKALLQNLKALGVGLKIDDFGTGYSSLRYLCDLPFDTLKIDRSFTAQLGERTGDAGGNSMVRTIISMAQNMNMGVIAEGVESKEHVDRLLAMGCLYGQGYFFSKPIDSSDAERLLASGAAIGTQETTHPACAR